MSATSAKVYPSGRAMSAASWRNNGVDLLPFESSRFNAYELQVPATMVLAGTEYTIRPRDLLAWYQLDDVVTFQALATTGDTTVFLNLVNKAAVLDKHISRFEAHNPNFKQQFGGVYCELDWYRRNFESWKASVAKPNLKRNLSAELVKAIQACTFDVVL